MRRTQIAPPLALIALIALLQLGCAGGNYTPAPVSMPAARANLPPGSRLFYDALLDYGDWTLIEPYGYVFRPDVNFVAWRPYEDGYWAPSDLYGWVWISAEPFGWATYHYGQWYYDRFQGWVWLPDDVWGPAWVAWEQAGDYVGWAPMLARGSDVDRVPGGPYVFVKIGDLGTTNLRSRTRTAADLGPLMAEARPIENLTRRDGITFNRGPSISLVERYAGPLPRVEIDDLVPASDPFGIRRGRDDSLPRTLAPGASQAEAIRIAAEEAAREARAVTEQDGPPPARVPIVRPVGTPPPAPAPVERTRKVPARRPGAGRAAPADTTR